MGSEHMSAKDFAAIINEKLNSGELTRKEASRRLEFAIEREYKKSPEEIRHGFIDTCEDLLYALNSPEEYMSRAETSKRQLEEKLFRAEKSRAFGKRLALIVSVAIVLVVGMIALDGTIYREWLTGESTEDMQQYEVTRHVVDPNLIEKGNAIPDQEFREINTPNLDEALEVLTYEPLLPEWYPDGWEVHEYYASADGSFEWFFVVLVSQNAKGVLKYEVTRYIDAEFANESIEQNEHGSYSICNGWDVYFTKNMERSVAVWIDATTVFHVHGPISQDDVIKIIESIDRQIK